MDLIAPHYYHKRRVSRSRVRKRDVTGLSMPCSECSFQAKSPSQLDRHCHEAHQDIYIHARCCGQLFFTRPSYDRHCKKHAKDYPCPECNFFAETESCLRRHLRVHSRTYVCPMCGYRASALLDMNGHIEGVHRVIIDPGYIFIESPVKIKYPASRSTPFARLIHKTFGCSIPCCISGNTRDFNEDSFIAYGRSGSSDSIRWSCSSSSSDPSSVDKVDPSDASTSSLSTITPTKIKESPEVFSQGFSLSSVESAKTNFKVVSSEEEKGLLKDSYSKEPLSDLQSLRKVLQEIMLKTGMLAK